MVRGKGMGSRDLAAARPWLERWRVVPPLASRHVNEAVAGPVRLGRGTGVEEGARHPRCRVHTAAYGRDRCAHFFIICQPQLSIFIRLAAPAPPRGHPGTAASPRDRETHHFYWSPCFLSFSC